MILSIYSFRKGGLNGIQTHQIASTHLQVTLCCLLLFHGISVRAQTVTDTIKPVRIHPDLKNMIRFSGFAQPKAVPFISQDSLKFTGEPSIGHFSMREFLKKAIVYEDKYRKQLEAIYKPLREEQQRIIQSGSGKGWIHYNAKLGYQDPLKMPVELMNENTHPSDKYNEMKRTASELLKKYEQPVK